MPKPTSPVWSKKAVTNLKDCTVAWRQIDFTHFTHKHQLLYLVWACMGCEGWPKPVTLPSLLVCPFHIPRRWGNTPLMAFTLSLVKEWVRLTVCWHRQVAHSVRDGNMVFDRGWKGNRKLLIPDNIQCSLRAQQQKTSTDSWLCLELLRLCCTLEILSQSQTVLSREKCFARLTVGYYFTLCVSESSTRWRFNTDHSHRQTDWKMHLELDLTASCNCFLEHLRWLCWVAQKAW